MDINQHFLQLIDTAPILELIMIDVDETTFEKNKSTFSGNLKDYPAVIKLLIEQTSRDSTAEVSFMASLMRLCNNVCCFTRLQPK